MQIQLAEGEQPLKVNDYSRSASAGSVRGALCLTTRRLVFLPAGGAEDQPGESIPLEAVASAQPIKALGLLGVGFAVSLVGGGEVRYHGPDGAGWAALVVAARAGEARPEVDLGMPPGPIEPVVSWPAVLAWCLAPIAFLPVLGVVPALGLLACGMVLAIGARRVEDRRVGISSAVLAGAAILLLGVGIASALFQGGVPGTGGGGAGTAPMYLRVIRVVVLIASVVIHECGHALAAYWAGDPTAVRARRLTLNPIRHIDLFGSIILPGILVISGSPAIFGWAKPVPVNPANYRRKSLGNIAVSLAGVSANLLAALACVTTLAALGALLRLLWPEVTASGFWNPGVATEVVGAPLSMVWGVVADALKAAVLINLLLMGFNLLPIPPLDGSHVLETILPKGLAVHFAKLRRFGFLILAVLLFSGVIDPVLRAFVTVAGILCYTAGAMAGLG